MSKRSGGVAAAESATGAFCEWRSELFRNPQKPPQARFANGAGNCTVLRPAYFFTFSPTPSADNAYRTPCTP